MKQPLGYAFETFKVMLYADPHTKLRPGYVSHALKRDMKRHIDGLPTELIEIPCRHDFESAIRREKPNVIFIPENLGPESQHMRDFSSPTIKALKNFTYRGGTLVMFGGASHYAMDNIEWYWDNGQVTYKGGLGETFSFVSGTLHGPHHRNPHLPHAPIRHNGCFEVPVFVPQAQGTVIEEQCWQGNCGSFTLNDQRVQAGARVLAYYGDIDSSPIAAVDVPYGTKGGNFILCSVMPHYKPRAESPLWNIILTRIETKKYGISSKVALNIGA